MSLTLRDEDFLQMVRDQVAVAVEKERPLVRREIIDSFKWVTETTGVTLLEIEGKDPIRTFRRLMNTYGIEVLKLGGVVRYRWKKRAEEANAQRPTPNVQRPTKGISIEELIEKHVVRASSKPKLRAAA
jgi:hypothetical protein